MSSLQIVCQRAQAQKTLPAATDFVAAVVAENAVTPAALTTLLAQAGLPATAAQQLAAVAKAEHFAGRADEVLSAYVTLPGPAGRVLPVTLLGHAQAAAAAPPDADGSPADGRPWIALAGRAVRRAMAHAATQPLLVLPEAAGEQITMQRALWLAQGAVLGAYQNVAYKSLATGGKPAAEAPKRLLLAVGQEAAVRRAVEVGQILAEAVLEARELVNMPANELGPPEFAAKAQKLAKTAQLRCEVLDERQLAKEQMHLHLSVGQASDRPPRLVHLAYEGEGAQGTEVVVLVGKGITFDSGGLCLKPADGMATMKMDMGGAAAVLVTILAAARLQLPVRVHAVLALAENMVNGRATRPGDVYRSKSGKTVEINNTDAEGRLVLADAITWAKTYLAPDLLVDVATLTGACMVALGSKTVGLMSNWPALANSVLHAAAAGGEDMWRLPLTPALKAQLKSDVADMRNTGERYGGAITAGLFLQDFVGETPWAHLDIAGPAWATEETPHQRKGGTGAGAATLIRWLMQLASGEQVGPAKAGGKKPADRSGRASVSAAAPATDGAGRPGRSRRRKSRER